MAEPGPTEPEWDGTGAPLGQEGFGPGRLSAQRAFLEQFLQPPPPPKAPAADERGLAAGLPIEAARAVLLPCPGPELGLGPGPGPCGAAAACACLAAALRLFALLVPGLVEEGACNALLGAALAGEAVPRPAAAPGEALLELAAKWGLQARPVASALESLEVMTAGRPAACCIALEAYVGVLEDPETGEEAEQEVGSHCALVVGGDVLGPNYVVFDPWRPGGGEVAFWSAHNLASNAPVAFIQITPPSAAEPASA